jgi:hypothetical protein
MLDDRVLRAYIRLSAEEGVIVRAAAVVFVLAIALALRLFGRTRFGAVRNGDERAKAVALMPVEASVPAEGGNLPGED